MEFLGINQQNAIQLPRLAFTTPFQQKLKKKRATSFPIVHSRRDEKRKWQKSNIPVVTWNIL